MRLSSNPQSSPAAYSTTSIRACPIRRHGRRSSRGTAHRRTSPPFRTWSTAPCPRGAAAAAPSSSSPRMASVSCTMAPRARRWPQTGRAASPRRPLRRARTSRCGCCAARLAARISCPSRRWSRSTWTRRGWTTRRSSSRHYRKTYPVSLFFSFLTLFFRSRSRYRRHRHRIVSTCMCKLFYFNSPRS